MRRWSCESLLDNRNKYKQKIDKLSNRMNDLQKDIEEIKMKNISPPSSSKTQKLNITNENKNKENNTKYISNNRNRNYNLYFKYNAHKTQYFSHNNSKTNIYKNKNFSIIPKEKVEYEYELRILKRKLNALIEKNKELKNNLNIMKEENNKIESNLNLFINSFEGSISKNKENNDNALLREIENIKYKKKLINKVIDKIKKNNNLYYNSYESPNNEEEYTLNLLLNLMDIRFSYENSLLFNYFFQGLKAILPNLNIDYSFFNNNTKKEILNYIEDLLKKENDLKMINKKYENSKKYYELFKNFKSIKNLENFLNGIILKNIEVEQSIKIIKKVLNEEEKTINVKNYNGMYDINKKEMIGKYLNRNKNNLNYNIDKLSFYTTNYYNNKIKHHNYDNHIKKSISKIEKERKNKSNGIIDQKNIIHSNYINYIQNKNKRLSGIRKACSKTINNKNPKNFNNI